MTSAVHESLPHETSAPRASHAGAALRSFFGRAGYRATHGGLLVSLGVLMRAFHFAMRRDLGNPTLSTMLELEARYRKLLERDLELAARGVYPRELLSLPWAEYAKAAPSALVDAPRILARSFAQKFDDLPPDVEKHRYPDYYLRNFHWQSDGWLSDASAKTYDLTVEVLFGGTADVMRRQVLPPLIEAAAGAATAGRGTFKVLDVACGTGRFLQQLHAALPKASLYGVDLSPHYVARARANLHHVKAASLLVENAETLPLKDATFDAVTSIFLFHELPKDARRNVMREALRVLEPGGTFVVCDSVQLTESPNLRFFQESFPKLYHEPYYKSYMQDDLGAIMSEVGFEHLSTEPHFVSKVVVGKKPR